MSTILSVIEVIRALSELIETKYPNYQVVDMDVDEDYPRPSYFIDVDDVTTDWQAQDYLRESSSLKIVFFAENRYEGFLELLDMKNALTILFNDPLLVTNGVEHQYINLLETTSELYKDDKVLTFSIQANLIQRVMRDAPDEFMEELNTRGIN